MRVIYYRSCFVDISAARLYTSYMDEHEIAYNADTYGDHMYITCYGYSKDMIEFNKWVLRTFRP